MDIPKSLRRQRLDLESARSEDYWDSRVKDALNRGALGVAHHDIGVALAEHPNSRLLFTLAARVLVRADALDQAKELLIQLVSDPIQTERSKIELWRSVQHLYELAARSDEDSEPALQAISEFLISLHSLSHLANDAEDQEAIGLLARVHKSLWDRNRDIGEAQLSFKLYLRSFLTSGGIWAGVNAATLARLTGQRSESEHLARQVLEVCAAKSEEDPFWLHATRGEALLLLGQEQEAAEAYAEASESANGRYAMVASANQQLHLMERHGFLVPEAVWRAIQPPVVAIFMGRHLDKPGAARECFALNHVEAIKGEIAAQLDKIGAKIGFSSASCGADLLFIDAMLERDGEVHILLPFESSDFRSRCVLYGGQIWARHFDHALKLATSVQQITDEPILGDTTLFPLLARTLAGFGTLHAEQLQTKPHLITVSESSGYNNVDGVEEIQKLWPSSWPSFNIALQTDMQAEPTVEKNNTHQEGRHVRAFLFCDVVGYSKLDEAGHPTFLHSFLRRIATEIPRPEFVNTGGDSLFVSSKDALSLAKYALELQRLIDTTNWSEAGLPPDLAMRCALHAGPAYEIEDPFTGRMNLYGSHVNRAARIEPITVPGQIYASEQFVAFIISDLLAAGFSDPASFPMGFTYLGDLDLAKSFGTQKTYRLYKREC